MASNDIDLTFPGIIIEEEDDEELESPETEPSEPEVYDDSFDATTLYSESPVREQLEKEVIKEDDDEVIDSEIVCSMCQKNVNKCYYCVNSFEEGQRIICYLGTAHFCCKQCLFDGLGKEVGSARVMKKEGDNLGE